MGKTPPPPYPVLRNIWTAPNPISGSRVVCFFQWTLKPLPRIGFALLARSLTLFGMAGWIDGWIYWWVLVLLPLKLLFSILVMKPGKNHNWCINSGVDQKYQCRRSWRILRSPLLSHAKGIFSLSLTCQISSSMHSKHFALLTNNPSPYEYEIK